MIPESLSWLQGPGGWLILGLLLLILECMVPGLVLIFFGLGALLTAVLTLLVELSFALQMLFFCSASVALLLGLRKLSKPILFGKSSDAPDKEDFIGQRGSVTQAISPLQAGRVLLHGVEWSATAAEAIPAEHPVEITGRSNLTLEVKPLS